MKVKINKRKYHFLGNKFIKFFTIPLLLLLLWSGLTLLYIVHLDTAFSLLSYNLPQSIFTHLSPGKLEKSSFISGEFIAQDNNLGILSLRFETFFRPAYQNEDLLLFQIKQKGAREWYYKNIYRDGTIYDVPFFPFGFPIISDSKGKTYEFKITSLKGDKYNSVAISTRWQSIAAKYKFSKRELLQSKISLVQFSIKKFINSFQTIDVLFSSFVYLLPLIFYLILLSPLKKYVEKPLIFIEQKILGFGRSKLLKFLLPSSDPSERLLIIFFDTILLSVAITDGLYLQLGNDFVYLFIPILWISVQKHFKFSCRKTFIVGIIILMLQPFLLLFNLGQIAVNLAVWAYLFLVAGTIQALLELNLNGNVNEKA
jgi:hypothetical protein